MTEEEQKPSALSRFSAYIKKNQAAEAERRKRTGEPTFSEEISKFGSDWGKGLTQGMANVGREEEAKLEGRSGGTKVVQDDDEFAYDILFGSSVKKRKEVNESGGNGGGVRSADSIYSEEQFIEKLCEFLRYVDEDDTIKLYRNLGKQNYTEVDHKYLSKLLTRFYGHKITLKERDLSIK